MPVRGRAGHHHDGPANDKPSAPAFEHQRAQCLSNNQETLAGRDAAAEHDAFAHAAPDGARAHAQTRHGETEHSRAHVAFANVGATHVGASDHRLAHEQVALD